MANKFERLQRIWHRYEAEREHKPSGTREAVEWAVSEGLLEPPQIDPLDILAGEMAQALREEYDEDSEGRRYRV